MQTYQAQGFYVGAWGEQWIEGCKSNISRTSYRRKYWVQKHIGNSYKFNKLMCRLAYEGIEMRDEGDHLVLCYIDRLPRLN